MKRFLRVSSKLSFLFIYMVVSNEALTFVGLDSFNLQVEDHSDCSNNQEAFDRFISHFDYSDSGLKSAISKLSENCQTLLRENVIFKREVKILTEIIESRFRSTDKLRTGDLELLEYVLSQIGETPSQHLSDIHKNFMSDIQKRCTPQDKRSKMPPVRDQDTIGWCYAYTAADMVSFKTGRNVSAIDVAINYNNNKNLNVAVSGLSRAASSLFEADNLSGALRGAATVLKNTSQKIMLNSEREGGHTNEAIQATQRVGGFCLEQDLPSDSYQTARLGQVLQMINEVENVFGQASHNNQDQAYFAASVLCENIGTPLTEIFGNLKVEVIADILVQSYQKDLVTGLRNLRCRKRTEMTAQVRNLSRDSRMEEIDNILSNSGIVGIEYNFKMLNLRGFDNQAVTYHASTIVGRKWNEEAKTCQYLVRNSWGKSCEPYREPERCEQGYIWIDRDVINVNTTNAYVYE